MVVAFTLVAIYFLESRLSLVFSLYFGLVLGMIGGLFLAKNIKDTLFGLEPFAIARLLQERDAMLQSVREGIVAIDSDGRITVINEEAVRLLSLESARSTLLEQKVETIIPQTRLLQVITSGIAEYDQEETLNGVSVVMNRVPVLVDGRTVGAIATFRDRSAMKRMAEELTGVRSYAEALRSQTHEFMNKLHVILGLVRMHYYDELVAYVNRIASVQSAEAENVGRKIKDPVVAGVCLGKLSRARELDVALYLEDDSNLPAIEDQELVGALVTIIGNLVDNAMEAVLDCAKREVRLRLTYDTKQLTVVVSDTGTGIPDTIQDSILRKGFSTKSPDRGFGLALIQSSIQHAGGKLTFSSASGAMTVFEVILPFPRTQTEVIRLDENFDR